MPHAALEGVTLQYEDTDAGDPVVFIHGSLIAEAFRPVIAEPAVASYRLITYRRRGYAGSTPIDGDVTMATQAADCLALLRHLDVDGAHLVGHSFGGAVALQVALDAPSVVRSLALLEPALTIGATGDAYRESLEGAVRRYREEDPTALVADFMQARWPAYRDHLDVVLPGAFEQAVADAHPSFEGDLPGLIEWRLNEHDARRITQPALSVLGGESNALWPRFGEVHRLLLEWLPHAEGAVIPHATHFLSVKRPRAVAELLAGFLARQSA